MRYDAIEFPHFIVKRDLLADFCEELTEVFFGGDQSFTEMRVIVNSKIVLIDGRGGKSAKLSTRTPIFRNDYIRDRGGQTPKSIKHDIMADVLRWIPTKRRSSGTTVYADVNMVGYFLKTVNEGFFPRSTTKEVQRIETNFRLFQSREERLLLLVDLLQL